MATNHHIEGGTILGTVSGTGLTVLANIGSTDIVKTVVLAAIGAVVSFCVSVSLKWPRSTGGFGDCCPSSGLANDRVHDDDPHQRPHRPGQGGPLPHGLPPDALRGAHGPAPQTTRADPTTRSARPRRCGRSGRVARRQPSSRAVHGRGPRRLRAGLRRGRCRCRRRAGPPAPGADHADRASGRARRPGALRRVHPRDRLRLGALARR